MILHIVIDDKFIDMAYHTFEEAYPKSNRFIILSNKYKLKYIKNTPIEFVNWYTIFDKNFLKSLKEYDFVCLHWLDEIKLRLISKADPSVKFVWIGWGGDYYDIITEFDETKLFKDKTLEIYKKNQNENCELKKTSFRSKLKKIIRNLFFKNLEKKYIVNRINYFAPVLYEDYELVKKNISNFKPNFISWNYGTLEDDLVKGLQDFIVNGNNILIGNSSTYENNHIDVFDLISKLNLEGRKIICPLSYGDEKYKKDVIKEGYKIFGSNFVPINEFLNIDDYLNILKSCSVAIMGHIRQQALGNIVTMMNLGAKVFLDAKNPVYHFFKKQNAFIFTLEDLSEDLLNKKLSTNEINKNREILKKHWSKEVIIKKTKNLIETVKKGGFSHETI